MCRKKNKFVVISLATALTIPLAPVATATAEAAPHSPEKSEVVSAREFQTCARGSGNPPVAMHEGEGLGDGITEPLSSDLRIAMEKNGFVVPASAIGIRHLDSGESVFVDKDGGNAGSLSAQNSNHSESEPSITSYGILPDEAKRIIGACLGVSWESGPLAEAIFREVYDVRTAAKFLIPRVGLGAAIGCAGGIIWEYI